MTRGRFRLFRRRGRWPPARPAREGCAGCRDATVRRHARPNGNSKPYIRPYALCSEVRLSAPTVQTATTANNIGPPNLASLSHTRDGARYARRLLAVAPDQADAYLATGVSDYIIGSLSAPVRWILRLGGYSGDKSKGIEQLQLTAERGQLLAPLARILLAIAYLRDGNRPRAREILVRLNRDFPANALFARELRRIDTGGN